MVQKFTPMYSMSHRILSAAFELYGKNIYEDVHGKTWNFYYERNYWRGINKTEEGTRLDLYIAGYKELKTLLSDAGIFLNKADDVSENACSVCIVEDAKSFSATIGELPQDKYYFIYHPQKEAYVLLSGEADCIQNGELSLKEVAVMLQNTNTAFYTVVFDEMQTGCLNQDIIMKHWYEDMACNEVEERWQAKRFCGLNAMEQLYQDLLLFALQGNDDWMKQWSMYIQHELGIVAAIRAGNGKYIQRCEALRNIVEPVIHYWVEKFLQVEDIYSLMELAQYVHDLLELERKMNQDLEQYLFSKHIK